MITKENIIAIIFMFFIAMGILYEEYPRKNRVVIYDCSIAEISPDYPIEVKEQCRKLRPTNYKSNI